MSCYQHIDIVISQAKSNAYFFLPFPPHKRAVILFLINLLWAFKMKVYGPPCLPVNVRNVYNNIWTHSMWPSANLFPGRQSFSSDLNTVFSAMTIWFDFDVEQLKHSFKTIALTSQDFRLVDSFMCCQYRWLSGRNCSVILRQSEVSEIRL